MLRALAGFAVVAMLRILGLFPPRFIVALGTPWLPIYAILRRKSFTYYHMRLHLAALSLRHLTGHWNDCPTPIEGEEHYLIALASGKPVALLGWHQGPVELLHHVPPVPKDGRPFFIATAQGFTPLLTRLMRQGREQPGKQTVLVNEQSPALRTWVRQQGVLAVMVDQVPGTPEDWFSLWQGEVEIPYPKKLLDWMRDQDAVFIAVSARLKNHDSILFRYEPVQPDAEGLQRLMETAIAEAKDQYNWSYPKIRISGRLSF